MHQYYSHHVVPNRGMRLLPGLCVRVRNVFDPLGDEAGQTPDPPPPECGVFHGLEYLVHLEVTVPVDEQLQDAAQTAVLPQGRAQLAVLEMFPIHVRAAQERRQERRGPGVPLVLFEILHFRIVGMLVAATERVHQHRKYVHETLDRRSLQTARARRRRHETYNNRKITFLLFRWFISIAHMQQCFIFNSIAIVL